MTFDVEVHHAKFGLFKDYDSSPCSLSCCGCYVVISTKLIKLIDESPNDPQVFAYVFFKGQGLDSLKVDLVKHLQPSIIKNEPYAFDKVCLSYFYRFV